jgi:bacteriocin biosynthesis cyclodehydratase domain-containing protein
VGEGAVRGGARLLLLLLHLLLRDLLHVTAIPERPLLAPWYRLAGDGDRLLLEHGQSVVALEGAAVRTLLPQLLPLLDGTRGYDDLVTRLGLASRPAIDHALETLASHGLLVEGPIAPPELRPAAHAVAAAFDLAPSVAAERLRAGSVGVVGSSAAGVEVARLLRLCGLGEVRRIRHGRRGSVDLALFVAAVGELEALESWNRRAHERGTRWLAVRAYDGRFAAVGPLVVPGESCCYECVLLRRASNLAYGDHMREVEEAPVAARADAAFEAVVAALAAHLALRWIAGRDTTLPGVLYAIEARPALSVTEHVVLRVPRCPVCSSAGAVAPRLPWHEADAA